MKKLFLIILLVATITSLQSQLLSEKIIKGLPSKEVYDILVDKKGFIWVGHEFGISRYDGLSFTDFFYANSNSSGITDLSEDDKGRIWFHNFSNQIFYIENERIHLIDTYSAQNEQAFFPRTAMYKNWLVATTSHGLFICNTNNIQAKYIQFTQHTAQAFETSSLVALKNTVVLHGKTGWYTFNGQDGVTELHIKNDTNHLASDGSVIIFSTANKDTVCFTSLLFKNKLIKAVIKNNELEIVDKIAYNGLLNSVSFDGDMTWINTKKESFTTNGRGKIVNANISKVAKDSKGNTWICSLSEGLKIQFKFFSNWEKVELFNKTDSIDEVRRVAVSSTNLVFGTENGGIYVTNKQCNKILFIKQLNEKAGSIENIFYLDHNTFLIGASLGFYILDVSHQTIHRIATNIFTIKSISFSEKNIYLGASSGLYKIPSQLGYSVFTQLAEKNINENDIGLQEGKDFFKISSHRCRSVVYNPILKTLYAIFNDGLYKIADTGRVVQYYSQTKKNPILNATWILIYNNIIYISTVNNGILFKQDNKDTCYQSLLTEKSGLKSNYVERINIIKNHLWIYRNGSAQILDMETGKLLLGFKIPFHEDLNILDIAELDTNAYVAAEEGFFKIHNLNKNKSQNYITHAYLLNVVVNNEDTLTDNNLHLPYQKQNIKFKIGVPFYYNEEALQVYYKLIKDNVEIVNNATVALQRTIEFNTLEPGKYTFIASTHKNLSDKQIQYSFIIDEVWWKSLWFSMLLAIFIIFVIIIIIRNFIHAKLTARKVFYEKKIALQAERQRISAEFHDDIGATISAMRLTIEMIYKKNKSPELNDDLEKFGKSIQLLSQKVREVIWSMNPENDSLEKLIAYIQPMANNLFENSEINLITSFPEIIPSFIIQGDKRRDIYLTVKEALHNILKHSNATTANLIIGIVNNWLEIEIRDNGKGVNLNSQDSLKYKGYGLSNMMLRIKRHKGAIEVNANNGTILKFFIPLNAI